MLREGFSNGHVVNTAAVSPHEAGSVEQHSFNLSFPIQMAPHSSLQFSQRMNKMQNLKPPTLLKLQRSSLLQNLQEYQTQA